MSTNISQSLETNRFIIKSNFVNILTITIELNRTVNLFLAEIMKYLLISLFEIIACHCQYQYNYKSN